MIYGTGRAHLGPPIIDGDGIPDNYDLESGDRPEILGDQMIWWIMNDTGGVKEWSFTDPAGLEVRVSAYAFDDSSALANTTFYRYELLHRGLEALLGTYFGVFVDADIGGPRDDYVGSDSVLALGFAYNGDAFDANPSDSNGGYGIALPALGYTVLGTCCPNVSNDVDKEMSVFNGDPDVFPCGPGHIVFRRTISNSFRV